MQATGFLPSRDGFPFRNDFDYPASNVGRGAPLAPGFGLGAGMCVAALDRWLAGRPLPVPPGAPASGDVLYEELLRRQVELLGHGAWDRILEWQRRPGMGRFLREPGVGELTRAAWRSVRRSIEAGMPVLLCVLRTRGPFANPSENSVVLAYRYERAKDTKRGTIWVYDPNRPGNDDVRLTIVPGGRRRAPEVTFVADRVRGFLTLPYDRRVAAPLRAVELKDADAGGFTGRAAALPGAGTNAVVRARNGGLVVVRGGKGEAGPRTQRIEGDVLVSDPVLVGGRMPTLLARAKDGTVIGFRRGVSGWRGRPMPSPKTPLQLDFGPSLVSQRGRVHAFGVRDGRLAHMQRSRAGMWSAGMVNAQVSAGSAERLEGVPSAVVDRGKVIRVFVRTEGGRIAHMALTPDGRWSAALLPAAEAAIAGDAVAVVAPDDDQVTVFAVTEDGELIQMRGAAETWRTRNLTRETAHDRGPHTVRVEIAVSPGPGNTLHVFGVSPRNGLVHYWCPPTLAWRAQDLTHGRAETGDGARVRGRPAVVRTADEQILVAAAAERGIVAYRWSADADWNGDTLPMPVGFAKSVSPEGPAVWRDARGKAHLLAVFEDGRAIVAQPGRPDSAQRSVQVEAARSTTRQRPAPVAEPAAAADDARQDDGTKDDGTKDDGTKDGATKDDATKDDATKDDATLDDATLDDATLAYAEHDDSPSVDEGPALLDLGAMAGTLDLEPQPDASFTLDVGFGSLDDAAAAPPAARDVPDSGETSGHAPGDEWGSYGLIDTSAHTKSGGGSASGFEPAEPLLADPTASVEPIELPEAMDLPGSAEDSARRQAEEEEERARLKAEEEERTRKKAEEEERARLKAEEEERARLKAEEEERARLKAEEERARKKAEEEERARKKAEEEERARLKAEEERARKKAEEEERARKKAEEAERARLKAEEERARRKAEEEERARKKAEEEEQARLKAEEDERARLKAEEEERARRKAEEEERARLKAEEEKAAERARQEKAAAKSKSSKGHKGRRPVSPALEGLPLLDDDTPKREPVAGDQAKPAASPAPKPAGNPKPKLRSVDDLIRLSDEHDPTFEKK